jgi:hypothetical protein
MNRAGAVTAIALLSLIGPSSQAATRSATYSVTFEGTWSSATHPLNFPSGAHFSGVIGAAHNEGYRIFVEGGSATEGLERLAEGGKYSPLDKEIEAAIKAGTAVALIKAGGIKSLPGKVSTLFDTDDEHSTVSVVTMIAPSPDWFAGVSVTLQENGEWVSEKKVTAFAFDAGTDVGTTYEARNADGDEAITLNRAPYFTKDGKAHPVGTFTFVRQ